MLLRVDSVSKTYHEKGAAVPALRDASLEIEAGQFVAIQGPSGSGKSTLLLVASGLLAPDAGSVLLADKDLYRLSPNERARLRAEQVGFVFQQFHLIPYLSVLENVLAASLAVSVEDAGNRARELLEKLGLQDRLSHVPAKLSAGERQRVALARAMLHNPRVIFADEPTGNLDAENAGQVIGYLRDFALKGGAVLLVTHDKSAASQADSIRHMDQGQLQPTNPEEVPVNTVANG